MPSCTIASIRAWPNAPRDCLLASTSRSVVTCEVRSVRFLCALSMMPSRSCSTRRLSMVWRVVASIDWPTRCVTESSRSLTARVISDWRPTSACAMASTRPVDSLCARSISLRRSSSSSARIACAIASSAPRRPERAMTMAIASSSTKASAPKPDQRLADVNRQVADDEKNFVHARLVARFAGFRERRGNIYGKWRR